MPPSTTTPTTGGELKLPYFTDADPGAAPDDKITPEKIEANFRALDRWASTMMSKLAAGNTPSGGIIAYAGDSAPDANWLFPYGQTIANGQTLYPNLWRNIGSVYKSGSSIILPDLRGRGIMFLDNMGGSDAGILSLANVLGTIAGAESHLHFLNANGWARINLHTDDRLYQDKVNASSWTSTTRQNVLTNGGNSSSIGAGARLDGQTQSSTPATDLPPVILLNCLIKV